ncbi:nucleotide-diphospho-sugar transferases superfamily protein [Actinidia rufa]|uniref:Glycosyltransferases n=1 Tax=Actinidia rufa TaxID=165716 RepID=A0A7J0DS63_9ERIC|nr:nucleotide-diphospho-sugar transferases superfamily protein [Actinidia rufa]
MASIRRTLSPVPRPGTLSNGEACSVASPLSKSSSCTQNYPPHVGGLSSSFSAFDYALYRTQALILGLFTKRYSRPLERPKPKGQFWKRSLVHFSLCFMVGAFLGLTPFASMSLSANLLSKHQAFSFEIFPPPEKVLFVLYMNRLAHTLRLIPPPLLWIVVDMGSQSAETADILRRNGGILYRHLVCYKNLTDIKDRGVHQRNAALSHIETHHLDGIVYFADDDNIYSVDLFEQMRKISSGWIAQAIRMLQSRHVLVLENCFLMLVPPLLFLLVPWTILSYLFACKEHLSLTRIQFPKLKRIGHRNGIWHIHSKAETITMRNKGFSKVFQKNSIALVSENPSKAQIYGKGDLPKAIGQIILGNIINSLCFWIHKVYIPSSFLVWTIALAFPRRFGTWAVATLMESNRRAHIQGPSCNGTQVIGWHSNQVTRRFQRFHAEMSGFAFNSTILWDPKRWHRPTLEPIRQFDTLNGRFQASSFIEQVVEDESQMECLPQDYSRIVVWHLHFESSYSYPPEWVMKNNLDVIASLA